MIRDYKKIEGRQGQQPPPQIQKQPQVRALLHQIFTHIGSQFQINQVPVTNKQKVFTIIIPTKRKEGTVQHYYIGHGFGGSSLMFFQVLEPLIEKGQVILWQTRGMGVGAKLPDYRVDSKDIQSFFLEGLEKILEFYKHDNATLICHSFSCYLALLIPIRQKPCLKFIKQLILLSPIGITPKQLDYKFRIRSLSDVFQVVLNKFGWAFKLTYKSPLRTILSCSKKSLVMGGLKQTDLTEQQKEITWKIVENLIRLPDGSQNLFFKYFLPRVLPTIGLEPLLVKEPTIPITICFGGEADWTDKSGAKRWQTLFPNTIKIKQLEDCGHSLPFHVARCRQFFRDGF